MTRINKKYIQCFVFLFALIFSSMSIAGVDFSMLGDPPDVEIPEFTSSEEVLEFAKENASNLRVLVQVFKKWWATKQAFDAYHQSHPEDIKYLLELSLTQQLYHECLSEMIKYLEDDKYGSMIRAGSYPIK